MRFYTKAHAFFCGVDLHARSMYVCVLDAAGKVRFHEDLEAGPRPFLAAIEPFREDVAVAVECVFTGYWLADLCSREGIPFVLGHALDMKAIHGGKAKNDRIDAHKIAALLRGGMFPQAYVYPREMRSTRDLLRRRLHLARLRGQLLAHIQNTNSQENLPPFEARIVYARNRVGLEKRFEDPSVRKSVEVDLALVDHLDEAVRGIELHVTRTAKRHDPQTYHLLRTVPGIGQILALTILYEVHDIERFPRVQDVASYSRLVKCAKESAGKRLGSGGKKIGNVHLKWAFSEAAVLFLRGNPDGQKLRKRLEKHRGKGKAVSILAHRIGRATSFILKRKEPFDMKRFLAA